MSRYYIAACVFTAQHPKLSMALADYAASRGMVVIRCCIPRYKVEEHEFNMRKTARATSVTALPSFWNKLPPCADFHEGDEIYTVCHNCANILEETRPDLRIHSIFEEILTDSTFPLPDLSHQSFVIQPCWRAHFRPNHQSTLHDLLEKCGADLAPYPDSDDFCGLSLLRPQPPRNPTLAPNHYAGHTDKFHPFPRKEQLGRMRSHVASMPEGARIVCDCHYCLDGLLVGGGDALHLAELLFPGT